MDNIVPPIESPCKQYDFTRQRNTMLQSNYGINIEEYNKLFEKQNGVCAVCGRPPHNRLGRTKDNNRNPVLCVDHDHSTKAIRGLLCFSCNAALGLLDDDPERILALLKYIEGTDEFLPYTPRIQKEPQELLLDYLEKQDNRPVTVRELMQYGPWSVRELKATGIRSLLTALETELIIKRTLIGKAVSYSLTR